MAFLTSRRDFVNYCLRQLGSPVIDVNVAEEQIEDRVDDALQKFWEFHSDGLQRKFIVHVLSRTDIASKSIPIEDNIITVIRVLAASKGSNSIDYQAFMTDIIDSHGNNGAGIGGYVIAQSYLQTLNLFFNYEKPIKFNRYTNSLLIDTDWDRYSIGDAIAIECYMITDPAEYIRTWNDIWLKNYASSLIKKQWGQNLIKYDGFQLPSGVTLNGRQLYDDATAEIEKLETELRETWELPPDFFVG